MLDDTSPLANVVPVPTDPLHGLPVCRRHPTGRLGSGTSPPPRGAIIAGKFGYLPEFAQVRNSHRRHPVVIWVGAMPKWESASQKKAIGGSRRCRRAMLAEILSRLPLWPSLARAAFACPRLRYHITRPFHQDFLKV
jgi:hypothetical protein